MKVEASKYVLKLPPLGRGASGGRVVSAAASQQEGCGFHDGSEVLHVFHSGWVFSSFSGFIPLSQNKHVI